jgi:hypothetical protein
MHLVYCDLLMNEIKTHLRGMEFFKPGQIKLDLAPEGYFQTTKKTMEVIDTNGTKYRVTVEEA